MANTKIEVLGKPAQLPATCKRYGTWSVRLYASEFCKVPSNCEVGERGNVRGTITNKRIRNILRKAETAIPDTYKKDLMQDPAEKKLAAAIDSLETKAGSLFEQRDYTGALRELAALQAPVDAFFDDVMVMTDDAALRDNRLALLNVLSELFLRVADISKLQS